MELKEYPSAIAKLAQEIHRLDLEISISQNSLRLVEYDIDQEVAFDTTLTNDAKRKARRAALLEMNVEYPRHEVRLEGSKNQRQFALIELDKLRGEFSVAKIEARERIARLETAL